MNEDLFLPLGSVVRLKEGNKRVMVTGYAFSNNGKAYDYTGCLYPEGYLSYDNTFLFNHDQIEEISFKGYKTEEFDELNKALLEARKEYAE